MSYPLCLHLIQVDGQNQGSHGDSQFISEASKNPLGLGFCISEKVMFRRDRWGLAAGEKSIRSHQGHRLLTKGQMRRSPREVGQISGF